MDVQLQAVRVAETLIDIEAELRQLNLWQSEQPAASDLASTQPFCIDTLTLPQWLQFIFLPRMYLLLDEGDTLPDACGIAPLGEEYFRGSGLPTRDLLSALTRVDDLLDTGPAQARQGSPRR